AIISVTDDGIGIAEDDLKLVFSRFWRADRARTYTEGGLGIGLAQAKAVVDQHGGHIDVTSVLGEGSTFSIYLPLHEQPQKAAFGRNILRRNSKQTKQEAQRARKRRERRLPWQR
ncbi:MAG: cell wall metabolism sensor histidine kinase WalK, partial [Coriobacteriaceae bacterium]|nr:cell wall metabolism sensor histidine kinase WalK [Coriobacteriaceae bacterium]